MNGHKTLALLPGHFEALKAFCEEYSKGMGTVSKLVMMLLKQSHIGLYEGEGFNKGIEFATWLGSEQSSTEFRYLTIPDETMMSLKGMVETNGLLIDQMFPRDGVGLANPQVYESSFTYRAGIWLLLAVESMEEGFLSRWSRSHAYWSTFASVSEYEALLPLA